MGAHPGARGTVEGAGESGRGQGASELARHASGRWLGTEAQRLEMEVRLQEAVRGIVGRC